MIHDVCCPQLVQDCFSGFRQGNKYIVLIWNSRRGSAWATRHMMTIVWRKQLNIIWWGGAYFEQHTWENGLCALRSLEGHTRCWSQASQAMAHDQIEDSVKQWFLSLRTRLGQANAWMSSQTRKTANSIVYRLDRIVVIFLNGVLEKWIHCLSFEAWDQGSWYVENHQGSWDMILRLPSRSGMPVNATSCFDKMRRQSKQKEWAGSIKSGQESRILDYTHS